MNYKITRYENYGKGFKEVMKYNCCDTESKLTVKMLKEDGFKRIKGSGIVGLSFEAETKDKMGKVQITIERVVE